MIAVLNFHPGDAKLALDALHASAALGLQPHLLILACPIGFDITGHEAAARLAFSQVDIYRYHDWPVKQWPAPQNHAWQMCARYIEHQISQPMGWLWWEPDACPLTKDWLSTLGKAYLAGRHYFAGARCLMQSTPYMNGVGIWPTSITPLLANCHALYTYTHPFDLAAERLVMRSFTDLSHLIIHERKPQGGGSGRHFEAADLAQLRQSHPEGVLYHGCTDGSLHQLIHTPPDLSTPPTPVTRPKKPLATSKIPA